MAAILLPGLGADDPRRPADPDTMPWAAVALLQVPEVSRCTAVMVAPDTAATAAHCLWNRVTRRVVPVGSIHLLLGYDAGRFRRHMVPTAITLAPGADPSSHAMRGTDLALLTVAPPVSAVLRPATRPPAPGTQAMLGGYGQDRAQRLFVDPTCHLVGSGTGTDGAPLLAHGCSGTRGTSGGALVVRDGTGYALAGIEIGASNQGAGGVAVPASSIAAVLGTR